MKKSLYNEKSLKRSASEVLINFLLGAAWALALLGAGYLFWTFLPFGIFLAAAAALIGSLAGLIIVVFLEVLSIQFEKLRELKKQTEILKSIDSKLNDS